MKTRHQSSQISTTVEGVTRILLAAILLLVLEQCAGRLISYFSRAGASGTFYVWSLAFTVMIFLFAKLCAKTVKTDLMNDLAELYLYDVALQVLGIALFYSNQKTAWLYHPLSGALMLAKFLRFFWFQRTPNGDLIGWPIFGLLGWMERRKSSFQKRINGSVRQNCIVYVCLVLTFPYGYLLAHSGVLQSDLIPMLVPSALITYYGVIYLRQLRDVENVYTEMAKSLEHQIHEYLTLTKRTEQAEEICARLQGELTHDDIKFLRRIAEMPDEEIMVMKRIANGVNFSVSQIEDQPETPKRPTLVWSTDNAKELK